MASSLLAKLVACDGADTGFLPWALIGVRVACDLDRVVLAIGDGINVFRPGELR